VNVVAVASSVAELREVAGVDEIVDDLRRCSLGDANGVGDVAETARRVGRNRLEHVRVVRHEPPAMVVVRGS
jgi:hypothetical protein